MEKYICINNKAYYFNNKMIFCILKFHLELKKMDQKLFLIFPKKSQTLKS